MLARQLFMEIELELFESHCTHTQTDRQTNRL